MRLRDALTGPPADRPVTHRELIALVSNLPLESRTKRAVFGESAQWGVAEGLIAHVANLIYRSNAEKVKESELVNPPRPREVRWPAR